MMLYIFLCLCTITQLRFGTAVLRPPPVSVSNEGEREEGGPKSPMAGWEGVSYRLYPELKKN